jgi:SAM-dependent methyltransferase
MTTAKQKIIFLSTKSDCFMADEWYQFATADHFWMHWRFEALTRIIPKDFKWGRTLEIGCGTGVLRKQIETSCNCAIIGCDLNLNALQMAIESTSPLYFYNIHQCHEELRESFSTIIMFDVLEHIKEPVNFFKSVSFHLTKGGKLIINVPALQFLYSSYDKVAGHLRRYNISNLENELRSAGFRVEHAAYWGLSLIPLLMLRKFILRFFREDKIIQVGFQPGSPWINRVLKSIMRIEYAIFPKPPAGTSLIVVARKE